MNDNELTWWQAAIGWVVIVAAVILYVPLSLIEWFRHGGGDRW